MSDISRISCASDRRLLMFSDALRPYSRATTGSWRAFPAPGGRRNLAMAKQIWAALHRPRRKPIAAIGDPECE